jgi:hypothetical protein
MTTSPASRLATRHEAGHDTPAASVEPAEERWTYARVRVSTGSLHCV